MFFTYKVYNTNESFVYTNTPGKYTNNPGDVVRLNFEPKTGSITSNIMFSMNIPDGNFPDIFLLVVTKLKTSIVFPKETIGFDDIVYIQKIELDQKTIKHFVPPQIQIGLTNRTVTFDI